MKKFFAMITIFLTMSFLLCGCGNGNSAESSDTSANSQNEDQDDAAASNVELSLTIDEAQTNRKLICLGCNNSSSGHTNEDIAVYYDDVLYGVNENNFSQIEDSSPIKQIIKNTDGFGLLYENGNLYSSEFEPDNNSNVSFANFLSEPGGVYTLIHYNFDGSIYLTSDYYDYETYTFAQVEDVKQIESIYSTQYFALLFNDGTVKIIDDREFNLSDSYGDIDVSTWSDICCIIASESDDESFIVGLKSDGTVVASGSNYPEEITSWNDIVDIQGGGSNIVGLKSDGTLIACDSTTKEEISDWNHIIGMKYGSAGIAAIDNNGTLHFTDHVNLYWLYDAYKYEDGQYVHYKFKDDYISSPDGSTFSLNLDDYEKVD